MTLVHATQSTGNDTSPADRVRLHSLMQEVRARREAGDLPGAIALCQEAKAEFAGDYLSILILGDLHFAKGEYEQAFICLADFLAKIPNVPRLLANFAKRYYRFRRALPGGVINTYAAALNDALSEVALNPQVAIQARAVIAPDLPDLPSRTLFVDIPEAQRFIEIINDDDHFNEFVRLEKRLEEYGGPDKLIALLDRYVLTRLRSNKTFRIDLYCVSTYEKLRQHEKAIKLVRELLPIRLDPVAIRSLFRNCRLIGNYDKADEVLSEYPGILKRNEFNVLYELVYYFEAKNDFDQLQLVLRTIERSFATNLPALRTVRNFYIRFGMVDDARRVQPELMQLYATSREGKRAGRFLQEASESDVEVASKMQELYSQLEHQKQLAAISDLTTGISHELGQPITNIRYTIQFYKRLFDKKLTKDAVVKVFDSILEETERMGGLVQRLSPLTSSRSVQESFDALDRIRKRVDAEVARLKAARIQVSVSPNKRMAMYGDPVKFDQLISNLLLNAIDAIEERKQANKRQIDIRVRQSQQETAITFTDTGIGIPIKNRQTIFDPFFSTKAPGKGEGLGLFIVWNLLKMQGGRIAVDPSYKDGARFNIEIPNVLKPA